MNLVTTLERLHHRFNRAFFFDKLPLPTILVGRDIDGPRGYYTPSVWHIEGASAPCGEIWVNANLFQEFAWTPLCEVMGHEMIHQWQDISGLPLDHDQGVVNACGEIGLAPAFAPDGNGCTTQAIAGGPLARLIAALPLSCFPNRHTDKQFNPCMGAAGQTRTVQVKSGDPCAAPNAPTENTPQTMQPSKSAGMRLYNCPFCGDAILAKPRSTNRLCGECGEAYL